MRFYFTKYQFTKIFVICCKNKLFKIGFFYNTFIIQSPSLFRGLPRTAEADARNDIVFFPNDRGITYEVLFSLIISAIILRAISCGVSAPISRPMGE